MRLFVATFILSLFLGTSALAMDGSNDRQEQEQMTQKTIIIQPDTDHTAIYVGAVATILAAGIGFAAVRQNRKG